MSNHLYHGHGTGAVKLSSDLRDWSLAKHPAVAPMVGVAPESFSLRQYHTGTILNQQQEPSCAAFSSCHMQALYESMERKQWITFDGHRLYQEVGGTGTVGVSSRDVLQDMQDQGAPVLNSTDRYQIGSYAFVDFSASFDFAIETIRAAVATNHPCVLAMLLPSDFGADCGKPGSITMGPMSYHQVLIAQYQPGKLGGLNSWGASFGDNGWFDISLDFLRRPEQSGWLYAFSSVDRPDDNLPDPVKPIEFDATVGKPLENGGYKIFPSASVILAKGAEIHCKVK